MVLEYEGQNRDKLRYIESFKKLKEMGRPVPFLDNMPVLIPEAVQYLEAFRMLSATRQGGLNPILLSEIKAYLDLFKIRDEFEVQTYVNLIIRMDAIFLKYERQAAQRAQGSGN